MAREGAYYTIPYALHEIRGVMNARLKWEVAKESESQREKERATREAKEKELYGDYYKYHYMASKEFDKVMKKEKLRREYMRKRKEELDSIKNDKIKCLVRKMLKFNKKNKKIKIVNKGVTLGIDINDGSISLNNITVVRMVVSETIKSKWADWVVEEDKRSEYESFIITTLEKEIGNHTKNCIEENIKKIGI